MYDDNPRDSIIITLGRIPSLPVCAVKVARLIQNTDFEISDILREIELDPGLTANVLKLANSAYFGNSRGISSIKDAIMRMGSKNLFRLVLISSAGPILRPSLDAYSLPSGGLWEHSVAVAFGVEQLCADLGFEKPGEAFTAALLHDVGKIALSFIDWVDWDQMMNRARSEGHSFEEMERLVLGIDHAEAGALILSKWKLPDSIVEAVRYHHDPDQAPSDRSIADLIHFSDMACISAGLVTGGEGLNYRACRETGKRLNLKVADTENLIFKITEKMEKAREILEW